MVIVLGEASPQDNKQDLIRARIVLLVLTEQFTEGLKAFHDAQLPTTELTFECAYCHYRLGEYEKALKLIKGTSGGDPRIYTLQAQILYRLGHFEEAAALYQQLLRANHEHDERLSVNLLAAHCCNTSSRVVESSTYLSKVADQSHEAQFNYACYLASLGNYEGAVDMMETSIEWAKEALLGEGFIEEAIERELRPYYLQKAFCLYKSNRIDEAKAILLSLSSEDDYLSLLTLFNKNVLYDNTAITRDIVIRLLEDTKLNTLQRQYALLNFAVISLKEGRMKAAARILRKLVEFTPIRGISTALLFHVLTLMNSTVEIKERSRKCSTMKAAVDLDKVIRGRGGNYDYDDDAYKVPAIAGVIYSKTGQVKNGTLPTAEAFSKDNINDSIGMLQSLQPTVEVKTALEIVSILKG